MRNNLFIPLMLFFLLFILAVCNVNAQKENIFLQHLSKIITDISRRYKISDTVLIAVIWQESKFHPWTVNVRGRSFFFDKKKEALSFLERQKAVNFDIGLMQINSWWIKKLQMNVEDLFEPSLNIELGTLILKYCQQHYGKNFLACYHTGKITSRGLSYQNKIYKIISFLKSK